MIIQAFDIFQFIADIIAIIVGFLQPIVMPIGSLIVQAVEFFLQFFPENSWTIYIIVFIVLVITGGIVNILYPGDKPMKRDEEKLIPMIEGEIFLEEKDVTEIESTESIDEFLLAEQEEMKSAEETTQDLKIKKEKKKKKSKKDKKEKKKAEAKKEDRTIEKEESSEEKIELQKKEELSEEEPVKIEELSEKQVDSENEEELMETDFSEKEKSSISKENDKENNILENKEKD